MIIEIKKNVGKTTPALLLTEKRFILKVCKLTGLTPYDVMESFISGAITALLLLVSVYPTFYLIAKIAKMFGKI